MASSLVCTDCGSNIKCISMTYTDGNGKFHTACTQCMSKAFKSYASSVCADMRIKERKEELR